MTTGKPAWRALFKSDISDVAPPPLFLRLELAAIAGDHDLLHMTRQSEGM